MIVIRTDLLKLIRLRGIAWFGFILFVTKDAPEYVVREEKIHGWQWFGMWMVAGFIMTLFYVFHWPIWIGLIVGYFSRWLWYVVEWAIKSAIAGSNQYANVSFEREAKALRHDPNYLDKMTIYSWMKYI